jgi:hypothetical protein
MRGGRQGIDCNMSGESMHVKAEIAFSPHNEGNLISSSLKLKDGRESILHLWAQSKAERLQLPHYSDQRGSSR